MQERKKIVSKIARRNCCSKERAISEPFSFPWKKECTASRRRKEGRKDEGGKLRECLFDSKRVGGRWTIGVHDGRAAMIEDATMIAFLFFVWMLVRSQEQENQKDGSRRDSSVRDNRDSRRNSKETASIGHASHLDKRRHRPRRHSRRYYVERNKRWVFYSLRY